MNILFLTPRDSKTNLGGVERHVKLLTEELVRRGHEVKELSLDIAKIAKISENREQKEKKDQKDKKEKGKTRRIFFKFLAWKLLWENRRFIRQADIIHIHDIFWWYLPFALIAKITKLSEKREPRVFVTFHGWEGRYPPTWVAVWQKRLAAFLSDGTIGVGSFFEKWYGVKTDRVVWGAIDPRIAKIAKISENRERGLYKGRTFCFFGRLEKVNGVEIVIESIAKIAKISENREQVIFVGDGSYRKLAESVGKVTGMVREPWKYLADADVVIASSYLAILEAAALGKRIIAIENNPLKRDYLDCHPLRKYFKICRSADELARKIIKSIEETPRLGGESPLRAKLWALGQTAEKLGDEYEKLWRGGGDG